MAETISSESKRLARLLVDIDNHRLRYKQKETEQETDTNLTVEFVSPFLKVYEHFKFYLLKNSVRKPLSPKNYYRPDYVSYEEYGTTILWTMILFINDIPSIEEFNVEQIIVPRRSAINRVARGIQSEGIIDLDVPDLPHNDLWARLFEKKMSPFYQDTTDSIAEVPAVDKDFYFIRQTFPVRNITVSQKYIDLRYDAVPESINFKVQGQPSFTYGDHYILVSNGGKMNRVTWSNKFATVGLEDVILEGMIIEISYCKEL